MAMTQAETWEKVEGLDDAYDVLVIGGGAAGLSGALMLARSRRSVAVIDAATPRNAPAEGVHGLLGREGTPPAQLLARGRHEVRGYGGHVVRGSVTRVRRIDRANGGPDTEPTFEVRLADGRSSRARRLLVTIGLIDELPEVPGLHERWGHDVIHCPYCHGWEVRDRAIGVLGTSPMSVHQALLFSQLSADVMLFTHVTDSSGAITMPPLTDEQWEQLAARGIGIADGEVTRIQLSGGIDASENRPARITGVELADGTVLPREVIAVAPRAALHADCLMEIGLMPSTHPAGIGVHIPADATGRSTIPGVWLAGNVTDPSAQVGAAAAAGAAAGAQINFDLLDADTRAAVDARRRDSDVFSSAMESLVSEQVTSERRHGL